MSEREWTMTALEFRVMMEQFGRDRLPFPLQIRATASSAAEYHSRCHEASIGVATKMDEDLREAGRILLDPRHRIEVVGHTRSTSAADGSADVKIRGHAAIGHDGATVLIQQPGLDDSSGGPVTIRLVASYRAVNGVLGALPDAPKGTHPRIDIPRPSPNGQSTANSVVFDSATGSTSREHFDRLMGRRRTSAGEILLCPGKTTDNRVEKNLAGFHWVDNAGDGRYLVRSGSTVSVIPASDSDVAAEVRRLAAELATET